LRVTNRGVKSESGKVRWLGPEKPLKDGRVIKRDSGKNLQGLRERIFVMGNKGTIKLGGGRGQFFFILQERVFGRKGHGENQNVAIYIQRRWYHTRIRKR